ncbi:tRNA (guanine(46)-N(7))-methyltransferase TrmB [Rhodobacter sp. Har01]|uniref:tRNA (guanine(46)-N(7))-methyltransferase TrmB n=1 Tax=Rhodobacter sp. Har01 TaxID=2883999 RepID=UPI001D088551|nr:tRNA (guanine(46)-N(7))-methyltransferase TrmB [Rhodobacter sp. Har01]MCB6178978.1 tRNA (guanine(46)-N(7))-methyltransferase TrmB [Rhodobacter sp. Har01]
MPPSDLPPSDLPQPERRNFYGRTHGKTLRASQRDYLAQDLEPLRLKGVTAAENPDRAPLDLGFAGGRPLWLEIGFGGGEHLVHMAAGHPEVHLIGAEPFVNGIAMLLGKIRAAGVTNLSLHPRDVRELFDVLPDACLTRVFLNYPDPWPKARHHRRRFVTPDYLLPLARVTAPGAEFRVATDIPDYVRQALEEVPPAGFVLERQAGPGEAWEDWISTRYEQKALREGRVPHYLTFRRA